MYSDMNKSDRIVLLFVGLGIWVLALTQIFESNNVNAAKTGAPVLAALTLLDSKIWVNARTHIPKPTNSNTIRSLLFISEYMEGI